MRKYLCVFSSSFKTKSASIMDTILSQVGYVLMTYILIELWRFIYGANGYSAIINGFSMQQMLWYLVITECIQSCTSGKKCVKDISNEVKSGSIAYKLNKPYDYYTYSLVNFFSDSMWKFIFYMPLALIVGTVFIGDFSCISVIGLVPCMVCMILACIVSQSMYAIIGLLSFWIEDATPFSWILQKVSFMCGMLFPIEFLPKVIQPIILYSPLYSVFNGPARLFGAFSWGNFGVLIATQVFWILVLYVIGQLVYSRAKRRVNANGG